MNCINIKSLIILPLLALSILMTGCFENAWDDHAKQDQLLKSNLMEAIGSQAELTTLYSVLQKTGYDKVLETPNSFTVFAPANSAWAGVDTSNTDAMRKLIGTLVVYKSYYTSDDDLYTSIKSINGKNIFYDKNTQTFNGAKITSADLRTANGVIHLTDKIVERRNNICEYLNSKPDYLQSQFINKLNSRVMDMDKSVATGVDGVSGKIKYDTVWKDQNSFFEKYGLNNEDSIYTYVVVENNGFNLLYNKYKKYFTMATEAQTDSTTRFNVCQDFVFKGIVDLTGKDTLVNVDGVKVPVTGELVETYNSSNGRVYVLKESNIRLKDKIKPVIIEGENYSDASDAYFVLARYKRWARGERDVALSCGETQSDTLYRRTTGVRDSIASRTYLINSGLVSNIQNFHIGYKANVNSANYDVYYVAYDDMADHADPTYRNFGVLKLVQKLYISMPGAKPLGYGIVSGTSSNNRGVANNYLGDNTCFVGVGKAGVYERTKLKKWSTVNLTQIVSAPLTTPDADVMSVPQAGTLNMWLCNTARTINASRQGLLFLDYIMLVPRITEE